MKRYFFISSLFLCCFLSTADGMFTRSRRIIQPVLVSSINKHFLSGIRDTSVESFFYPMYQQSLQSASSLVITSLANSYPNEQIISHVLIAESIEVYLSQFNHLLSINTFDFSGLVRIIIDLEIEMHDSEDLVERTIFCGQVDKEAFIKFYCSREFHRIITMNKSVLSCLNSNTEKLNTVIDSKNVSLILNTFGKKSFFYYPCVQMVYNKNKKLNTTDSADFLYLINNLPLVLDDPEDK